MGQKKVSVTEYVCERCDHEWLPRVKHQRPTICPKCKTPYWDRPKKNDGAKNAS